MKCLAPNLVSPQKGEGVVAVGRQVFAVRTSSLFLSGDLAEVTSIQFKTKAGQSEDSYRLEHLYVPGFVILPCVRHS